LRNRNWEFSFGRTDEFYQDNFSSEPITTGVIGLIIASLISFGNILFSGQRNYLEAVVKSRTRELEKANKSKTEFLANMSHDLRTPLNAIIGFSDIMKQELYGEIGNKKYRDYSANILTSSEYLLSLINEILDFSVLDAEKRVIAKQHFDAKKVVEDCYLNLSSLSRAKNITCECSVQIDMPEIYADYMGFKQILINLISNSIKYTASNGKIKTSLTFDDDWVTVVVSDNGYGIDKKYLEDILEPFIQADDNPHLAREGTGLGLSIVKSLVDLHQGTIELRSYRNVGTSVTIKFPRG